MPVPSILRWTAPAYTQCRLVHSLECRCNRGSDYFYDLKTTKLGVPTSSKVKLYNPASDELGHYV